MKTATQDVLSWLEKEWYGDPKRQAELQAARESAELARTLYQMRMDAKLTQRELAKRVGTSASVISRIENDDYEGHSLSMLRRVAAALGKRVHVSFEPALPIAKASRTAKAARPQGRQ